MSHYVLVHGAWEESQAWEKVVPSLEAKGHQVSAIDLPGHGKNLVAISDMTMQNYIKTVTERIEEINKPVILVAHSMSGAVVSQVAEIIPERIERLVYVCAFLLEEGATVMEAMSSDDGQFLPNLIFAEDMSYASVPEATLRSAGFHDVDEDVIEHFLPTFIEKQSTEPFMAKVAVSQDRFGKIPKTYIRTSIDRVTTPALQDRMIKNWNVENVLHLEAGHFPSFSVPEKLADLLLTTA